MIVVIMVCTLFVLPKVIKENRGIDIDEINKYRDNATVCKNNEDELFLYVQNYFSQESGYIQSVDFSPIECLEIANGVSSQIGNNSNYQLVFLFSNGTKLSFSDVNNGRFINVIIDNSSAYGYTITNISYYSDYTCFKHYYVYGLMNDYPVFTQSLQEYINNQINGVPSKCYEVDRTLLSYAINKADLTTDEYTYAIIDDLIRNLAENGDNVHKIIIEDQGYRKYINRDSVLGTDRNYATYDINDDFMNLPAVYENAVVKEPFIFRYTFLLPILIIVETVLVIAFFLTKRSVTVKKV